MGRNVAFQGCNPIYGPQYATLSSKYPFCYTKPRGSSLNLPPLTSDPVYISLANSRHWSLLLSLLGGIPAHVERGGKFTKCSETCDFRTHMHYCFSLSSSVGIVGVTVGGWGLQSRAGLSNCTIVIVVLNGPRLFRRAMSGTRLKSRSRRYAVPLRVTSQAQVS